MKKTSILLFSLALILSVYAHEYILLASKFKVNKNEMLELHLFVADGFNIELERPLQKQITKKFELITRNRTIDLLKEGNDSTFPIVSREADFEGLGLFHMERGYAKITLDKKKFLEYLKEDHIENISTGKIKAGEQKERYSRYIKCLVQSGKTNNDTLYKTNTGQPFEIILLQNPYTLKPGNSLSVKIFFNGTPLAGKLITIRNRTGGNPSTSQVARTDSKGICNFKINGKGDWFIHATHMIQCPDPLEADWESFWASYSFGVE